VQTGQPSQTARGAAAYRAIHQTLEGGAIFSDPFASRILDDMLAASVTRDVRQVVVLGAGLDTFSLRNPYAGQAVRVFEVDYPSMQDWKRERLKQAGLAVPASLTFAPVDFERQSLADGLKAVSFQTDRPAFFQWLGVVPYLTREAVSITLDFIAGMPESEVVFHYAEPFENYPAARRANVMAIAASAAARGEPWLSLYDPAELSATLRGKGFGSIEDLGLAELIDRFYGALKQGIAVGAGPHVLWAQKNR
jgi:methyltransferase (TIGR00027 family)